MGRPERQTGVGLIEILIAVLVLSIGFLGMAALQAKALVNNNSAMMRTQATIASYSIIDAMRADRANAIAGSYNTGNNPITVGSCPSATGTLAQVQLKDWCNGNANVNPPDGLAALGPKATGAINCDANGNCTVAVTFTDDKASGGGNSGNAKTTTITTWAKI